MPDFPIPLPSASVFDDWEQYIPLLITAVDEYLIVPSLWAEDDYPSAYGYMQDLILWLQELDLQPAQYARSAFLPGNLARKITGAGTITTEFSNAWALGQRTYLSSPAVGDEWEYSLTLAASQYEFRALIQRPNSTNYLTVDWYLDDVLIVAGMTWQGSSVNFAINNTVYVNESGMHTLRAQVATKVGSGQPAYIHYLHFVDSLMAAP